MSKNIILFVALESELPMNKIPRGVEIHYTGVGKVNAAIKASEVIYHQRTFGHSSKDTMVLNYGSAGSTTVAPGSLVECKHFVQYDMKTPFGPFHSTPFDELVHPLFKNPIIEFGSGYICKTQDTFEENPNGVFDMEAYAIAKVCKKNGFDFTAYKYISDGGDVNDWNENHSKGVDMFLEVLNNLTTN